jgi:hypothetical protein
MTTDVATDVDFSPPPTYEDLARKDIKIEDWNDLPTYTEALNMQKLKS